MIVERLKIILSHFHLSPSAFADTIGVPRSSMSHLLSGRNKPSLDFVLKLVNKFPEVNLYWLLYGEGEFPFPKDGTNTSTTTGEPPISTNTPLPPNKEKMAKVVVFYEDGTFETYLPKK